MKELTGNQVLSIMTTICDENISYNCEEECPFRVGDGICMAQLIDLPNYIDKVTEICQNYYNNLRNTYIKDFYFKYPKAQIFAEHNDPTRASVCRLNVYGTQSEKCKMFSHSQCRSKCIECWNEDYDETR